MMKQGLSLAKKPHIVIATPGRLADHLANTDTVSLKRIKFLVSAREVPAVSGCVLAANLQFFIICVWNIQFQN